MNIILFGPPGAGKGTQSKYIAKKIDGIQISTGDILRDEITKNTDIGKIISNDMNEGKFVSDEIVNMLVKKIIFDPHEKNNFIFDGYPRSLSQAQYLDAMLKNSNQRINFIFSLNVSKEIIIKRIEKRKSIEKRSDDELNTIIARYNTYIKTTKPVIDFYSKNSNFYEIDGALGINEITSKIDTFINV